MYKLTRFFPEASYVSPAPKTDSRAHLQAPKEIETRVPPETLAPPRRAGRHAREHAAKLLREVRVPAGGIPRPDLRSQLRVEGQGQHDELTC